MTGPAALDGPVGDRLPSPLDAVADMRATARWTIGAAAAVGALLLGTAPLAALSKLNSIGDAVVAFAGLTLALSGVCWAIWKTSEALTPPVTILRSLDEKNRPRYLDDLVELINQSQESFYGPGGKSASGLQRESLRHQQIAGNLARAAALEQRPQEHKLLELAFDDANANIEYYRRLQVHLLALLHTWHVRHLVRRARLHTMASVIACGIGTCLFLTATLGNQPKQNISAPSIPPSATFNQDSDSSQADCFLAFVLHTRTPLAANT